MGRAAMESTVAGRTKEEWMSWVESKPKDLAEELTTLVNYAFHYVEGNAAGGEEPR